MSGCTCFSTCEGVTKGKFNSKPNLVDVDGVRLLPLALPLLLVPLSDRLGGLARLGCSLSRGLGGHLEERVG